METFGPVTFGLKTSWKMTSGAYATIVFKQPDWMLKMFNQSKCLKSKLSVKFMLKIFIGSASRVWDLGKEDNWLFEIVMCVLLKL